MANDGLNQTHLNQFQKLGLSSGLVEVLDNLGFTKPTPVQEEAIPMLINQDPTDFIGLAQTGTGKTAAFGLPLLELIESDSSATQALIMAPTRELAQQTAAQLKQFSAHNKKLNVQVVYGGEAITNHIKALKKPTQVVVATPGRLLDLIKRKAIKLDAVEYVVLDEADEMLNMGFQEAIDEILEYAPDHHVTWLFSATMPKEIRKIVKKYMIDPAEVSVNTEVKTNQDITHQFVITKTANKIAALKRFLDIQPDLKGVMFCRTKRDTQQIADELSNQGYAVEALHGDLSQAQRDTVMKKFKSRAMQLLIATDVAARGIDVNDLTHVINHRLPDQLETYTHRSGRTGRAGKKGVSMVFINPREGRRIQELENKLEIKFERVDIPSLHDVVDSRMKNWATHLFEENVHPETEMVLSKLKKAFSKLSKDEILSLIISHQLNHMIGESGEVEDLNEGHGGKPGQRDKGNFNRYFINVGQMDGLNKKELVDFIADVGKIDAKYIGDIILEKSFAYFELDRAKDKNVVSRFKGFMLEGREIRVNRDNAGESKKTEKKPKSKKGSSTDRRKSKSRFGGGRKKGRSDRRRR